MFKNVAAKFVVFAFDTTTNLPKTGDAANLTAYVSKDYAAVTVLADTSATEMDATNAKGYYLFDAAQGETNADVLLVSAKSVTANISVIGAPAIIFTRPTTGWLAPTVAGRTLDVSAGGEAGIDWANIGSPTTAQNLSATNIDVDQIVASVSGSVGSVIGAVGSVTGAVGSVTGLTAATVHADLDDIQARLPAALTVDGNIKSDTLRVGGTLQTAGDIIGDTNDIQARLPAALVSGRIDASVGAMAANVVTAAAINAAALNGKGDWNIGKTGYALSAAGIQAIWDALTSALITVGSIGKLLVDNINATISSRSSHSAADVWASATRLLTAGTNIVLAKGVGVTGFNDLSAADVRAAVGLASANLDTQLTAIDDLLDTEIAAIIATLGVAGAGLTAIPWNAAWDAEVESEATDALNAYDGPTNAELATALAGADDAVLAQVALVKAQTDLIPGTQDGLTFAASHKLASAAILGKVSGYPTSPVFRSPNDLADRVAATLDADGNRTAVTLTP